MMDEPIPTTKDRPGSYDAIETAKPGEPLFPIQGGDPFGPATVLHWVQLCRARGMVEEDPKKAEHLLRKATDAEQIAWEMMSYQRGDEYIEARRARYMDDPEQAHEVRTLREHLIRGVSRLHNLIAEAAELAELLAEHRVHPEQQAAIRASVSMLKEAASAIEPRRGREQT